MNRQFNNPVLNIRQTLNVIEIQKDGGEVEQEKVGDLMTWVNLNAETMVYHSPWT